MSSTELKIRAKPSEASEAVELLCEDIGEKTLDLPIPFDKFIEKVHEAPSLQLRNIFSVLYDMVNTYIIKLPDENKDDPENIGFINMDCSPLFAEGHKYVFIADSIFANRLLRIVESMKKSKQQNKIYIFKGPHGCGKSIFLNNLLNKLQLFTHTDSGLRYETIWRFNIGLGETAQPIWEKISSQLEDIKHALTKNAGNEKIVGGSLFQCEHTEKDNFITIPCPSHDNPILMIPREYREKIFEKLFDGEYDKQEELKKKEYDWVFTDKPCTICSSLFMVLLEKYKKPEKVFKQIFARPYRFDRRKSQGINVMNPGDPYNQRIHDNEELQKMINRLLGDSNRVTYKYSEYAMVNNGVYALMDVKSNNVKRMNDQHGIVSEGVHKVEDLEENVNPLLLAVMNPEDQKHIADFQSFSDRIEYINIPYVMDINTEVEIYRNIFGKHIDDMFLPRVLNNFARVIVSTRLNKKSDALLEWIGDADKYRSYCDENLQLLKMEIYTGYIPSWLNDEDRGRLTAPRRRKIIAESESEGEHGISGRDSLKIFNDFYTAFSKEGKLINMSQLCNFFINARKELAEMIPGGFMDSLLRMYDYSVLQEVKESLYYYNEEQISQNIQNYIYATNFEKGEVAECKYTGNKFEVTDEYFEELEKHFLGPKADKDERKRFRTEVHKQFTQKALTQEINIEDKSLTETKIYETLHERYVYWLKQKSLDPFIENKNFRGAIKDFNNEDFKTYDKKIKDDVSYMITNLIKNYKYNKQGALEVCQYVIDSDLANKFAQ